MIHDDDLQRAERITALCKALTAPGLHDALALRHLPVSGTKAEQAARLVDSGHTLSDVLAGVVRVTSATPAVIPPLDPPQPFRAAPRKEGHG